MSTNYYADFVVQRYDIFNRPYHLRLQMHIGKRVAGWRFMWQGYKDHEDLGTITTVRHWESRLRVGSPACYCGRIYDECGVTMTADEMLEMGTTWGIPNGIPHAVAYPSSHNWLDGVYDFTDNDFS